MMTSFRNWPLSRHSKSSVVTVILPLEGADGYWINLTEGQRSNTRNEIDLISKNIFMGGRGVCLLWVIGQVKSDSKGRMREREDMQQGAMDGFKPSKSSAPGLHPSISRRVLLCLPGGKSLQSGGGSAVRLSAPVAASQASQTILAGKSKTQKYLVESLRVKCFQLARDTHTATHAGLCNPPQL